MLVDRIAWQWYLATAAIPFVGALVGFIAGIVFMARSKIGPALALWATAWLAAMIWGAIGWAVLVAAAVEGISESADAPELVEPFEEETPVPVDPVPEDDPVPAEPLDEGPGETATVDLKQCGNLEASKGSITCAFAQNVFYEYWTATDGAAEHDDAIEAYSPALEEWLELSCTDGDPVACTTDVGGEVRMPRSALEEYTQEAAEAYAADHTVSR